MMIFLCLVSLSEDFNRQMLEEFLQDSEYDCVEQPTESHLGSWGQRQKDVQLCWQQAGDHNVDNLLSAENTEDKRTCQHCHLREAVIRCGECMPSEFFCAECDHFVHERHTLHNRQTTIYGYYKSIPPTESVILSDGN